MHQIQVTETLDVEAIERELGMLWKDSAASKEGDTVAVMRARVANLMTFVSNGDSLDSINATLCDLSAMHPCRAIVIVAERQAEDRDIELYVSSFHHDDSRGGKRLCCEEVVLIAKGSFVPELPSAALHLLVPDLPTFLWWRAALQVEDRSFGDLSEAADRLVIDTAEYDEPQTALLSVARVFKEKGQQLGISDINWARLTSWRALVANFNDAPDCKAVFSRITNVVIEYSAPDHGAGVAPQALLFAGWLASRLNWNLASEQPQKNLSGVQFELVHENRRIFLQFNRVDRPRMRPGRLARALLTTDSERSSFVVMRDEKGLHLETQVLIEGVAQPRRVLPVRNRSTAQLIGRELEIPYNDNVYAEAVEFAARMIQFYSRI